MGEDSGAWGTDPGAGPDPDERELEAWAGPEFGPLDHLECVESQARMMIADLYRTIGEVLDDAERFPDPWCGADPTSDPGWVDPRGRTVGRVRAERREFAVRAAVLDIAMRLRMSEQAVRGKAFTAAVLRERCPRVWAAFGAGDVGEANARAAADAAGTLPDDAPDAWAAFDEQVVAAAGTLTPGKFRTRARAVRERVHRESVEVRHRRAVETRSVWVTPEYDGMAVICARVPAVDATAAMARIDTTARHLHAHDGESRTLGQVRADVFTDLLTTTSTPDTTAVSASIAVTVPVMTLLGHDTAPATLDGYGPIDLDTAKTLAGGAASWVRVLTHPVTGTVLDVDRTTYRVPADLRRWLQVTQPTCTAPGCARPARECDIDHRTEWQHGGTTSSDNLGPMCEPHHRVKTETLWSLDRHDDDTLRWTSPTGATTGIDPPPF